MVRWSPRVWNVYICGFWDDDDTPCLGRFVMERPILFNVHA